VTTPPSRLFKVLGVAFGVAIIVGNTISSGILRTPGEIAAALPHPWLFLGVWAAGGLYALFGAMTMAELVVMIPLSGGQYVYARRALGEYAGFVIGWTDWISSCASGAAGAIALGELGAQVMPALAGHEGLVATLLTIAFAAVQWMGIKTSDRSSRLLSSLKVIALLAVAAACFTAPSGAGVAGVAPHPMPSGTAFAAAAVLAFQSVLYTYDGWNGVTYFGGEVSDPGRQVPRAMALGVLTIAVVYIALNAAFLHVLGIERLAGEKFAAAAAALIVFGGSGESVVRAVMAVTMLSGAYSILMLSSRVPYAMAMDRLAPRTLTHVNRGGTPDTSLAASVLVTVALTLSGTFNSVLAIAAFFFVMQYGVSFASLFVLRRREPDLPRPYLAWGYPWIPGLVLAGAGAFVVATFFGDTTNSVHAVIVLVASYPAYRLVPYVLRAGDSSTGGPPQP
jgi:APA family basic amino acid/polyamine antiporter